jgi:pimeloyl-ACP methyl ester carboxylesterase
MHKANLRLCLGAAVAAAAFASPAFGGGEAGRLELRDFGGRFVGYTTKDAANASVDVLNPMFVQYVLPARQRHRYPVVFIHGGGGQGTDWTETPDGRDGWTDYFVADGWDVYVVDRPGHGRSQSNPACGNGQVRGANTEFIARLSTSNPSVWPGGEPTPKNSSVIGWAASSATAPYCGNEIAAKAISALLDQIGPAVLVAHSAGGGSTFLVPDLNAKNVVGIIAFEAAGANPLAPGFNNSPPAMAAWVTEPRLPANFSAVNVSGCGMQGDAPSRLVNFKDVPLVLVGSEFGMQVLAAQGAATGAAALKCQADVWKQAGVDASYVYFPDRGLAGGGHFAMAQLDNAAYAKVFLELAAKIEASAKK